MSEEIITLLGKDPFDENGLQNKIKEDVVTNDGNNLQSVIDYIVQLPKDGEELSTLQKILLKRLLYIALITHGGKQLLDLLLVHAGWLHEILHLPLGRNRESALAIAVRHNNNDCVAYLLTQHFDVNALDAFGFTPLHNAASETNVDICRMLLGQPTIDVDKTVDGDTAYDWAVQTAGANSECAMLIANAMLVARKPSIMRNPSTTIVNQGKTPLCWKHAVTKLVCRFIFITIEEEEYSASVNSKCDVLYDQLEFAKQEEIEGMFTRARRLCSPISFKKLVLNYFFHLFAINQYGCKSGQSTAIVLKYIVTNILQTPISDATSIVSAYYASFPDSFETRLFKEVVDPILARFYHAILLKKQKPISDINVLYAELSDSIENNVTQHMMQSLQRGFYINIICYLGCHEFITRFSQYNATQRKPIPLSIHPSDALLKSGHTIHTMTIVGYELIRNHDGSVKPMFIIKNSWGADWGKQGTIRYTFANLLVLRTKILLLLPTGYATFNTVYFPIEVAEEEESDVRLIDEDADLEHFQQVVLPAILTDDMPVISAFCTPSKIGQYDNEGKTMLIHAIMAKKEDICRILIQKGVPIKTLYEHNPLELAIRNGLPTVAANLLDKGANVNEILTSEEEPTVLFIAIEQGNEDLCRTIIIRTTDLNRPFRKKVTPLHKAIEKGLVNTTLLLLERGSHYDSVDEDNNTPLHIASLHCDIDSICLALLERGADIHAKNNFGQTPLQMATGPCKDHEFAAEASDLKVGGATKRRRNKKPNTKKKYKRYPNKKKSINATLIKQRV